MKRWYEIKAKADETAEVWIYGEIGWKDWNDEGVVAKEFAEEMSALKATSIDLHVNSPGGYVTDGHAIYNAIRRHPANVTTYIDGLAASIASVIALAGEKVVMAENALFMIHNPYGFAMGTAEEMRKTADVLDKMRDTIAGVYADRSNLDMDAAVAAMDAETWYTAAEAIDAGFADELGVSLEAAAKFDLSRFKNPPVAVVAVPEPPVAREDADDEIPAPAPAARESKASETNRLRLLRGMSPVTD